MSDIERVANKMELKCNVGCDHKFCLNTFVELTFMKEMIKRGVNGKFYKCKESQSEREFALKIIDIPDQIKYIEENINNYQHLSHHERIIKYWGNFEHKEKLYIFMEYINGGSLHEKILNRNRIPHKNVIKYTKQILEGLSFLHENKIIHRDIKPSNILMLESDDIKICDFGLSRCVSDSISGEKPIQKLCTQCGTYNYMAPEIINNEAYSYPIDIWSVGATFVAMVIGNNPYSDLSSVKVAETISKCRKIDFVPTEPLTNEMKKLVDDMLKSDPSTRPTAKELLNYKILL